MFGPPKDVDGQCNARLKHGDDYGDNTTTYRCGLAPAHQGRHVEQGDRFRIEWDGDDRDEPEPIDDTEEKAEGAGSA